MSTIAHDVPKISIGQIKTFGDLGPIYEVRRLLSPMEKGDWLVEVLLVETGETAKYPYSQMINDPEAK
jgi:hypothetical protein